MNTTARLTTADLDRMTTDDRWLGFGYLGERRNYLEGARERGDSYAIASLRLAAADQRVVDIANDKGLTYDELFAWANSKTGRWFGDVVLGGAGRFDERIFDAERWGYLPGRGFDVEA